MNDLARQRLREIVARHGRSLCRDPRRCHALLADHCPDQRRELLVLVGALEERVADELLGWQDGLPWESLRDRLVRRLVENRALSEEAARWAVESWALALQKISEEALARTAPKSHQRGGAAGTGQEDGPRAAEAECAIILCPGCRSKLKVSQPR